MFAPTFMIWAVIAAVVTCGMGLFFRKKSQIFQSVLMFIVFYVISWLFLPPIAIDMLATWELAIVITFVSAFITWLATPCGEETAKVLIVPLSIFAIMFVGMIATSGIFNATEMAKVADVTDHGQKETTMELASQEQAQRVTPNLAEKKAAELIGSAKQKGLASVARFGTMYGNVTPEGKAVWMAPLEPNGFWRWVSNPTTPGYFIASHVNSEDSRLIEDKPISYGTSGFYFSKDLHRHLYVNGYVNYQYGDTFFQVDDEGVPYYVVPLERPQVGFWSYFPEKWVVVNAKTGDIKEVDSHEDLPNWVDRAYSNKLMEARLEDWGCFSAGAWACYFSGVEVIDPTPGMIVTMDHKNTMVYITGTQFQNNKVEGGTSGVATVNARTGKIEFYRRAGITETAAMEIVNGAVANFKGRDSEPPVLVQVNGLETYFSVITDASGARKGYGMVWQRNRNVYGTGDSVEDATRAYLRSARKSKSMTALEGNTEIEAIIFEGLVVTITPVSRGGETTFYLRIDTVADKIFVVNMENLAEVATTNVGEPVRISTFNAEPSTVEVDTFDNLAINLNESDAQIKLTANTNAIMQRYKEETQRNDADAQLRELNPEQVRKLLKMLN